MVFQPRLGPVKEGRSYPGGLPYAGGPNGRMSKNRQMAMVIIMILCLPACIYYLNQPSVDVAQTPSARLQTALDNTKQSESDPKVVVGSHADHQHPAIPGVQAEDQARFPAPVEPAEHEDPALYKGTPPVHDDDEPASPPKQEAPAQPKGYGAKPAVPARVESSAISASTTWGERPRFEKALAKVINMLPGEMHMRDLLRQVEGTGKEKLREMGLRVRAYKSYFEAWEDLHLDTDAEGGTYIRDDVVQYLRNHDHGESIAGLTDMPLASAIRSYESYRYFLAKFGQLLFPWTAPYFSDHMTLRAHFKRGGRGIVLTAGDDQAPYLLTSIPILRQLGCNLPVEVMYLGDSDLSEDFRADLEAMDGVITRDIAQMVNDEGWRLAGWAAKPFAMLFSSFREVIFIDADSLFFVNPATLFDDPEYQSKGALFFRDRLIMPESRKRWLQQILPKPISKQVKQSRFWTGDSGHMQESGVVVVDKWRHFMAMLLVTRMNGPDRDGNKDEGRIGVYDMVYGDKETFWIGWELVGDLDYAFHQGDAGIMGTPQEKPKHDGDEHKDEEHKPKRKKKRPSSSDDPEGDSEPKDDDEEEEEPEATPEPPKSAEAPDEYTICAPQLLHLNTDGTPLWFNGWLLDNKFADRNSKKFGAFDTYLVEPRDIREPGAWQLHENNQCCLTTDRDKTFKFTERERGLMTKMMERARVVGAPGGER